jgi:hypothetical protein
MGDPSAGRVFRVAQRLLWLGFRGKGSLAGEFGRLTGAFSSVKISRSEKNEILVEFRGR